VACARHTHRTASQRTHQRTHRAERRARRSVSGCGRGSARVSGACCAHGAQRRTHTPGRWALARG
jgi:hypothetical protein